jgi:preprotein translocase subunit SecA
VLKDITMFFLLKEEDIDDRLSMEVYIVYHLSLIRPSIKLLKSDYPEFYKMNQEFYNDALNEKKNDYLIDKYIAVEKKLAHNKGIYFDSDKTEEIGTYTRETPKTGRNDPCPCGSGKKYKKCCGRN